MKKHIITLGGFPGSGKSTTKRLLSEKLNYKTFSTGDFVRDLAHEQGLSLEAFNDLVSKDKSLDILIDEKLIHIETSEDFYILDSHLAVHFVPSSFSVYLHISPEKSAERIFNDAHSPSRIKSGDTMDTIEEALVRTQKRVDNHIERYMRHYGINPYLESNYTLVIDTEKHTPAEAVEKILTQYESWLQLP